MSRIDYINRNFIRVSNFLLSASNDALLSLRRSRLDRHLLLSHTSARNRGEGAPNDLSLQSRSRSSLSRSELNGRYN